MPELLHGEVQEWMWQEENATFEEEPDDGMDGIKHDEGDREHAPVPDLKTARAPAAAEWVDEVYLLAQRLWYFVLAGTSICGAALLLAAVCLAGLGLAGLGTAAVLHGITSEAQDLEAPLYFDYSEGRRIHAVSKLLLPKQPEMQSRPPRVPWPGQVVDLRIDLALPEMPSNCEVFMVKVELLGPQGAVLESRQRPAMLECRPTLLRTVHDAAGIPLSMLGLRREARDVSVELFRAYRVSKDHSIASVSVELSGRDNSYAPQISEATVRVHLRLDFIRQLLYFVRHNQLLFGLLVLAALASLGCSTCCALAGVGTVMASGTGWMASPVITRPDVPTAGPAANGARRWSTGSRSSGWEPEEAGSDRASGDTERHDDDTTAAGLLPTPPDDEPDGETCELDRTTRVFPPQTSPSDRAPHAGGLPSVATGQANVVPRPDAPGRPGRRQRPGGSAAGISAHERPSGSVGENHSQGRTRLSPSSQSASHQTTGQRRGPGGGPQATRLTRPRQRPAASTDAANSQQQQ